MSFPAFFNAAPVVRMRDPLSQLLGATPDGVIEYRYIDAVRLAGHSCPTVAGAFLMGRAALNALYPQQIPERGNIEVNLGEAEDAGVTGVIAQVLTLLTGAAGDNGFKGLAGRHKRRDLLRFGCSDTPAGSISLTRRDTGTRAIAHMNMSPIPVDPEQDTLLSSILRGQPSAQQEKQFGALWQDRVRRLLERADDPEVICVTTA
ncbi:MAG TPA: hypothetical protein VFJ15_00790 [Oleiagrimonas sp.]|nr:hypothetical protein [Oleiagrimonas sp.]